MRIQPATVKYPRRGCSSASPMSIADPIAHDLAVELVSAITAIPGVAGLHGGEYGNIALLYPGARIPGLRIHGAAGSERLEVHVVVDLDVAPNLLDLATRVRGAAAPAGFPIDVVLADATSPETCTRSTP